MCKLNNELYKLETFLVSGMLVVEKSLLCTTPLNTELPIQFNLTNATLFFILSYR